MQSRTSSYKRTWLLKNVTRFAPFWVLYTLCLLLGLFLLAEGRDRFYFIMNLSGCARMMAVVNFGYALLTAQLLFGDLYDSRMCYGIHSLPMRREEIYFLNIASGLLFSLVPTALMTVCALPIALSSTVPGAGAVPLLWFAAANLQYLFFFALAIVCAMCAGSRFSMAVVYGILNFAGIMAYLLVDGLFQPLLPGVSTPYEPFYQCFPVGNMAMEPLMLVQRLHETDPGSYELQGSSWNYLLICGAVSIALLLLGLQMYRKRSLETAGEFIAVKALRPVFLVLFALAAALFFSIVIEIFLNKEGKSAAGLLFTLIGLSVGWFVGLMLLRKTTRVFTKKNLLGGGLLVLMLVASLLLTWLDVFGIGSWVPESSEIRKVYVIPSYNNYGAYWTEREQLALTEPEDLKTAVKIHSLALEEGLTEDGGLSDPESLGNPFPQADGENHTVPLSLQYHMKDGTVRQRYYYVDADGEAGQLLKPIFSRANVILEKPEVLKDRRSAVYLYVQGHEVPEKYLTAEEVGSLLEAISSDCREGNLAQQWEYHRTPVWSDGHQELLCLDLSVGLNYGSSWDMGGIYLAVYSDSVHTMQWLKDRGMVERIIEDMKKNS